MAENENYDVVEETTEVTEYAQAENGAKKDKWGAFDIALITEAVVGVGTTVYAGVKLVPKFFGWVASKIAGDDGEEVEDLEEEVPVEEPKKETPKKDKKAKKDKKEPIEEVPVKKTVKTVKKKVAKEATEEK